MKKWSSFFQPPRQGVHSNNAPCQDNVCVKESNEIIAVAVSDGLGSLKMSEVASNAVTTATVDFLTNKDNYKNCSPKDFIRKIVDISRQSIIYVCEQQNLDKNDMDCTLLFAVLFKHKGVYLTGQLGDGAVCLIKKDEAIKLPNVNDDIKSGANMTKTIFSSEAESFFVLKQIDKADDILGIVLTTDGLQNEIYSARGDIKQNIQWYYNTIVSCNIDESRELIGSNWNKLAENNPSEFSDDMSLAAIYRIGETIELPQDANWLCVCGHRNNLESSRCNTCMKDFLRIYKGAPYQDFGGKKQFFLYLNKNPQEELKMLSELCTYELPDDLKREKNIMIADAPDKNEYVEFDEGSKDQIIQSESAIKDESSKSKIDFEEKKVNLSGKSIKTFNTNDGLTKRKNCKLSKKQKIQLSRFLIIAVMFFLLGFAIHLGIAKISSHITISKLEETIVALNQENAQLTAENQKIAKELSLLKEALEDYKDDITIESFLEQCEYYQFENEDVFYGEIEDGLPNGFGILFSGDKIYIGEFSNGEKTGKFYVIDSEKETEIIDFKHSD